jgi:hypothetical protein
LSNRGRAPGAASGKPAAPKPKAATAAAPSKTAQKQKAALMGLADMVGPPVVALAQRDWFLKRFGEKNSMGLAGNAVIFQSFAPHLADGAIQWSQSRPGILAWLDTVEDNAPAFTFIVAAAQMTKAMVSNMLAPDPRLAQAGVTMARIRAAQMAAEIEAQARAMGISDDMPREHPKAQAA